jgi:selenocysteine-specific translation elongation factor
MAKGSSMDGITVGVFGTDQGAKSSFESSVAKKSEAEGIAVYSRTEGGRRYSLLDTSDYPERIQGYARIASLADHALYFYPSSGRLAAPDGELAILIGAFGLRGTLELLDGAVPAAAAVSALKGTPVADFRQEGRLSGSSAIDLSSAAPREDFALERTLVYVDRAFTVKGVGTVALGFVLSGTVSVHDQLRPVPGPPGTRADVKGIQVNDVDFQSAGRGIRVGLSLRGVEPKDLERSHWLDDGSFALSDTLRFGFTKSPFYRQEVAPRDLHVQLPGEMVPARVTQEGGVVSAKLPWPAPAWEGMRGALLDLNGGALRVAGGLSCKL